MRKSLPESAKLSAVRVRARSQSDLDACLELAHVVRRHDGYPPRGPVDVEQFMAPPQQLAAWVAEIDSTIVGHAALHMTGAGVTMALAARHTGRPPEQLAVVARVLVGPTARRSSVGRALLATATADAHDRDRHPILDVATHFRAAIGLYESCGWDRAGEVTIEVGDEPSLQCYVYVGPLGGGHGPPHLTRP